MKVDVIMFGTIRSSPID